MIQYAHPTFWLCPSIAMVLQLTPLTSFTVRNHFGARELPNIGLHWPRYVLDVVHEVHNPAVEAPSSTTKERQRLYDLNRHFQDNQVAIHYWAEAIYGEEDAFGRVLCRVCFPIEG